MAKKIKAQVKVQINAGKATAAPPVGTALGPHGINMGQFIKEYNERTASLTGTIVPAVVTVFEGVRPVFEHGHDRGDDGPGQRRGALVVLLDELAHVDAVRPERRADRRRRRRLAGVDLHFYDSLDLLRHLLHLLNLWLCQETRPSGRSRSSRQSR